MRALADLQIQTKKPYYEFVNFETQNIKDSWNVPTTYLALRVLTVVGSFFKSLGSYCWTNGEHFVLNIGVACENFWKSIFSKDVFPQEMEGVNEPQEEVPLNPQVVVEDPKFEKSPLSDAAPYFPMAAIGASVLAGIASRFADKLPSDISEVQALLDLKNKAACRAGFSSNVLQGVNSFKQWELKNFALLTPLIPILIKITADALFKREPGEGIIGLAKKFVEDTKNQVTVEEGIFLATIITLSLLNPVYGRTLGLTTKGFDSSGHLMLKGSLALFLTHTLKMIKENSGKTLTGLALAFGVLYGASDFIFLYNTSAICHTASELLAGIGWAAGVYSIGRAAASVLTVYSGVKSRLSTS